MGGMTGLLLLLWAGVTVGSPVDLQKRIIGGGNCPAGHRLYHVILISRNVTHRSLCGGSLISKEWVLTAAHCWKGRKWTMTAYLGRSPAARGMVITDHHIYADNLNRQHDLMLLKLSATTKIKPVKLPDCNVPLNIGDEVEIAGHASTQMGPNNERLNDEPLILQCANTDRVNCTGFRQCLRASRDPEIQGWLNQHWFCGQRTGVDVSIGDSGGGVVFKDSLYGVNSFTRNGTHACVAAFGFMDVCHKDYQKWIYKTTGIPRPVQG